MTHTELDKLQALCDPSNSSDVREYAAKFRRAFTPLSVKALIQELKAARAKAAEWQRLYEGADARADKAEDALEVAESRKSEVIGLGVEAQHALSDAGKYLDSYGVKRQDGHAFWARIVDLGNERDALKAELYAAKNFVNDAVLTLAALKEEVRANAMEEVAKMFEVDGQEPWRAGAHIARAIRALAKKAGG